MHDFFISYNHKDQKWAEWIAWILEENGYSVYLEAWDFRPGSNFVLEMDRAAKNAQKTLLVLSPAFLEAAYTQPEWAAAFRQDPEGTGRNLVPVRVRPYKPEGLLGQIVYVDLVGRSEEQARADLLAAFRERGKPSLTPVYPGGPGLSQDRVIPQKVSYPGPTEQTSIVGPDAGPRGRSGPTRSSLLLALLGMSLALLLVLGFLFLRERPKPSYDINELENRVVSLSVKRADVAEIVRDCAQQVDAMPALDPKLHGPFTIRNTEGKLKDIMDAICASFNCTWSLEEGLGRPTLVVDIPDSARP